MNQNILTVAQVNSYIKRVFEMDYVLKSIWIQGEVSNCKIHSSGHIYFTLKDGNSAIACVMFKGYRQSNQALLKDGMKIIANGSVSVYEKSGQYQLYVREYMEDGIGFLYKKFEELKALLDERGWFLKEHKKPIPFYPRKVGVVTSETGAAIQDIINISRRRNPYIQLVLYPSLVQGAGAKECIVKAIQYLDKLEEVDVIIVGRGGGSLEDLWPFNEEIVAKAIYEAKTPIISAVGHEIDFTISDFVSDLRAPTPSAAAELAIPSIDDLNNKLRSYNNRLNQMIRFRIEQKKSLVEVYLARFERYHPRHSIEQVVQYINELEDRLEVGMDNKIKELKNRIALLNEHFKRVSPIDKLKNGYVYLMDEKYRHIKRIDDLNNGDNLIIQLYDGQLKTTITNIEKGKLDNE